MQKYITSFVKKYDFPKNSAEVYCGIIDKLKADKKLFSRFKSFFDDYDRDCDLSLTDGALKIIANEIDVRESELLSVFYILLTKLLKKRYLKKNISLDIWDNTVRDLSYKVWESYLICGDYGSMFPYWYHGFFEMKRFAIGRLQFEFRKFYCDYEGNNHRLNTDSDVLEVHIPRTGKRLYHDEVVKSYSLAADFFKEHFSLSETVFVCSSWLLFPDNKLLLNEQSNLIKFMDDYSIIYVEEYPDYSEAWRLFDMKYDGNPDKLPADSSLRRGYIDWIKSGKKMGFGTGVIFYN